MNREEKKRFKLQRSLPCTLHPIGDMQKKVQGKTRFEFKIEFAGGAILDFTLASPIATFFMIDKICHDGINVLDGKDAIHGVEFIPRNDPRHEFDFPRGTKEITIGGENIDGEEHFFIGNITSIDGASLSLFDKAMAISAGSTM